MSYLTINSFLKSGQDALDNKNYWCALSVALALPSICSRLYFQDEKYKGKNSNDKYWHIANGSGKIKWHDKKCYIDFCKEIMKNRIEFNKYEPSLEMTSTLGNNFANVLYDLRCDILHAGNINIMDDNKGIYLSLGDLVGEKELSNYRVISVEHLCKNIFDYVRIWGENFHKLEISDTYIFDIENNFDDKLLLKKLCEDERVEELKSDFTSRHNSKYKETQDENNKKTNKN